MRDAKAYGGMASIGEASSAAANHTRLEVENTDSVTAAREWQTMTESNGPNLCTGALRSDWTPVGSLHENRPTGLETPGPLL
jgi:hypothetical protein